MENKTTLDVKELSALIASALKSQNEYVEVMVRATARESAKEVVKELTPVIVSQMKDTSSEIAKRVVKDACEKLVLEVTGEDYGKRATVRDAIQWAIKSKDRSNIVTNRILIVVTSVLTGAALMPLVEWLKKF